MLTNAMIEAALRDSLPAELHPHLASIARIFAALSSGALLPDEAEARLAAEPSYAPILGVLARRQESGGLVAFGSEAQTGDIGINDIVGGNLLRLTVNNYYGGAVAPGGSIDPPAPSITANKADSPHDAAAIGENPSGYRAAESDSLLAAFVAGPPILHPRAFFGRETIVRRIFGLLKRVPLQNAVVIGPRRSGKTSLLHYLRQITRTPVEQLRPGQRSDWLDQPERYHWVMIDFQDARLSRKEGLLRALLSGMGLRAPEPCTLDRAMDVISGGLRQPTVVLLDEVGKALQSYRDLDDDLWESLRALGPQVGGTLGFVLAAHTSPAALAFDSGHSSPFFNIFGYTATLGPFTEVEARELINSSPVPFAEEDVQWILAQSHRWPILLQMLCRERLISLEDGEESDDWRKTALEQAKLFQTVLNT